MSGQEKRSNKVRFQQKKGRPPISREEAEYWLDFLPKVLKIGTEFEINPPSAEPALRAKNDTPCIHAGNPCVNDCTNLEMCLVNPHPSLCLTRATGVFLGKNFQCPAKNLADVEACRKCEGWALNCRGLDCSMYTPFCTICPAFRREGEVVESGDIRRDAETIREELRQLFEPTEFVGHVGKTGVLEVKKDGSLLNGGGIEIPTVGRRVHWQSFYNMCNDILRAVRERGGFVNERCGQHYHVLAGYLPGPRMGRAVSELEKPLPEVILANFHQLCRRYELAMFWITTAGDKMNALTRWARFRQSIRRFSALRSRMTTVKAEMGETIMGMNTSSALKGKYASVTYHFCEFNDAGDATTFHVENRIADGALSPAVATSWAMLYYAMVLKAVRLSQYGIMETGDEEYMTHVKAIQPHLIAGETREWGDFRTADTSKIGPHISWLRQNARELVSWLKPELSNLGPSYEILMSLADKPCSLRLVEGQTWEQIEEDLYGPYRTRDPVPGSANEEELREVVDLASIVDCNHLEMWIEEVAAFTGQNPAAVATTVHRLIESGEFRWSDPVGALITR